MNNTCEYLWTLLAMAVSVLPIAIVLFRVSFVKNAVFSLKKFWHNHSFQNKVLFLILFTTAFIYGSSKPSKGNGMKADDATVQTLGKREKVSHIVVPLHTERRERDTTRSLTNDFLLVSGIDFSQHNNELNFSLTWSEDLFDFAESRAVDLFVSTNLTLSTWFHGGKYLLPYDKTNYYFSVDLYNPAYDALLMLTNKCAFFKFGLDADSDGDSLTDACEKYLHGTNPILTDSDHDGIDDGLEIRMGLNPLNSDIDNDGIPDGIELDLGGNPISLDSDNDGMEDRWEFDNALDISDDSDGLIDSDGDGVPNLYEYANNSNPNFQDEWMTPKIIAGDTSKTNGVADLSSAFMRSVPYSIIEIADGIYSGTGWTGLTIPTNQVLITTGNFVINTNCWAYGIDTTSASMWNSHEYNKRTGTAISKRHLVQANHFPIYRNKAVFFYCNDDTIHTNYIDNYAQVLSTDISICSLRYELPDTITPAMVLPQDYREYIGNGKGLPYLCFDYDEHAIVGDIASIGTDVGCGRPMLEHRRQYYERIISGDSGNPCFLVIGNSVIMLNEYHYATHGPFLTYYMEEIQQVMDELSPGYELNIFNFSEFVKIKEDRVW